ncbi:MAG TPA: hypothetical protein PLO78_07230 [Candidatus Omnitrophota bacterium]|nr:hypothetical protein [Candidatus Omnitrophota bacterium]
MENNKTQNLETKFLYFQLSNEERESAIYFLLESILKVREQVNSFVPMRNFDEDVNIYLAHLLFAMSLPDYHEMADPFISSNPQEVFEWVRQTEDPMLRYFIFKVNADNLLIQSTIFNPNPEKTKRSWIKRDKKEEKNEDRLAAILYYNHAARAHKGIYDKRTGVGEVLEKIAGNLDLYRHVLIHMKDDYFKFIECFREQAFQRFLGKLNGYEKEHQRETKMEQFLDAYQGWLQTKYPGTKKQVLQLVQELKQLDPHFNFDVNKLNE